MLKLARPNLKKPKNQQLNFKSVKYRNFEKKRRSNYNNIKNK